ncbi:MAG: metal ABC transporter substrate-binding protein [Myxococcota bacterium]|jgi:ABC-type Zn uptake system ZnuABC Zn-binding protein ZnuA|nr:metal ABC transporter substrate-binding protein [Myxococcota bacterium]
MKPLSLITGILLGLFSHNAAAQVKVITTTTDLAALVQAVGGDHVTIEALCKANQDPHYVQTRPSLMVKLKNADMLVSVGLDLETGWLPLVIRGARNAQINPGAQGYLDLGASVSPIGIPDNTDASQGHLHAFGNPHYWLDPQRVTKLLPIIAEKLSALAPEHRAVFSQNASDFSAKIQAKMTLWKEKMAPYAGTEVLSYHDTFNYFYARFGLLNVGTLENKPGIPPSPRHLSNMINKAKSRKIPVLFHEAFHDKKPSGLVAERSGISLLILPVSVGAVPTVNTYIQLIDSIVEQFVSAMQKR